MSPETDTVLATLRQTLASCFKLIVAGDYATSEQSVAELGKFLNSISDALLAEEPQISQELAVELLTLIHQYVATPTLEQEVIDALAFELPKAVARFACVSARCLEVAEGVVNFFVERCGPRDMLSILLEAISSLSDPFMVPDCFIPLLSGLAKVIVLIQRRLYEQVKNAVPVILKVLTTMCLKSDDEDRDYEKLFHRAADIACSIRTVGVKLEGEEIKKLNALLGLYVLQITALVSLGMASDMPKCLLLVLQLSNFLHHCDLSYIGLLTGCEVDMITKLIIGDDSEVRADCFSQVKLGAALSVIWGFRASEAALAAKADLPAVLMELQGNWTRRWEAVGMLKYLFSGANLPWELKQDGIRFLLCIMDGNVSRSDNDCVDSSIHMPTMYTGLQAIEMMIMYSPDSASRKNAFMAFKKVLADIPTPWRFDVLVALIKNSNSSSMIGILIDCVKEEMRLEKVTRNAAVDAILNIEVSQSTSFWNPSVLELVEMVLRPPKGGPPSLPEYSDAVLSALNLYRFILITESTGNSNSSGILSKEKLQKAYKEWLLPLRALVAGAVAESKKDYEVACEVMCGLNPVELVLYRCIELVEEKLKHL
ncbi:hypothetical protein C2S53_005541 [Perilla frutescens var. hirtella]|uniref:Aberrant root formation protein 4 n=1 Tax=Perilla frutescens var. hirtella TaxID=608512 RepID=A0AAD4JEE0_PERFH|nr:hypothetical protein C2S53_005541 [Perilla frutescens var. hirtella]